MYVYIQLIHFIIQQKLSQHGKATIRHYHPSCAQLRWLLQPPWTIELATPWTIQLETLWTIDCQAPLSMGFPRQEYCSGLSFPPPGIFPTQGSNLLHLNLKKNKKQKRVLFMPTKSCSLCPACLSGSCSLCPSLHCQPFSLPLSGSPALLHMSLSICLSLIHSLSHSSLPERHWDSQLQSFAEVGQASCRLPPAGSWLLLL